MSICLNELRALKQQNQIAFQEAARDQLEADRARLVSKLKSQVNRSTTKISMCLVGVDALNVTENARLIAVHSLNAAILAQELSQAGFKVTQDGSKYKYWIEASL